MPTGHPNIEPGRPICPVCNKRYVQKYHNKYPTKDGIRYVDGYYRTCNTCRANPITREKQRRRNYENTHRRRHENSMALTRMKDKCAICGFVPKHHSQMDIDHIDGNRFNNEPSNLQVLCANCHRLKTIENKDHLKRRDKQDCVTEFVC